jgi:hypothetical protein
MKGCKQVYIRVGARVGRRGTGGKSLRAHTGRGLGWGRGLASRGADVASADR